MLALQGYRSSDDSETEDDLNKKNVKSEVKNNVKDLPNNSITSLALSICAAPEVVPTVSPENIN